jgi:hypothetical protein
MKFDTEIHTASSVMSLAILSASAIIILSMTYNLYQARKNKILLTKDFKSRLGALTQGQRTTSFSGVYWRILLILRWTSTMLIMTLLRENFYFQIFPLLVISAVFQLIIVGSKPLLSKVENHMLLFNEIMVSIYLYLLLSLTDYMVENDFRDVIAWALLSIVVFTVLVNLVKFLIVCDWCKITRKFKKKCLKAKKYVMKMEDSNKQINELIEKANQSE